MYVHPRRIFFILREFDAMSLVVFVLCSFQAGLSLILGKRSKVNCYFEFRGSSVYNKDRH